MNHKIISNQQDQWSEEIVLETKELAVGYKKQVLIPAISFSVRRGEILVLIGPNGAGKSTILKTIVGQLEKLGGSICILEEDIRRMKAADLAKRMSLSLTTLPAGELMTVEDMVSTGRYPYTGRLGILSRGDREKVENVLTETGLLELRDRPFDQISDGQRQRVMLARALCQEPEILIMDEPTSFLDIRHKLELLSMLKREARERRIAVILSLHEIDLAQKTADRLLCVAEGRIDACGSPEEILTEDYVRKLYRLEQGSYLPAFGSLELEKPEGDPEVFVIGGGGSGIPVYRSLQRQGIPFAAGILSENDMDYPVAKALAAEVVSEKAYTPISVQTSEKARSLMERCSRVICTLPAFGEYNRENERLTEIAAERGVLEWQR